MKKNNNAKEEIHKKEDLVMASIEENNFKETNVRHT